MNRGKLNLDKIADFLSRYRLIVSAPLRIDCGNTWDVKAMGLLGHYQQPNTVNIAINLRTQVVLLPFKPGWAKISSAGYPDVQFPLSEVPFNHPLGLAFAVLYHFRLSGVHVSITNKAPICAGLGGSAALAVCLISAVSALINKTQEGGQLSLESIARFAHDIEDGLRISYSGLQDQLSAVFGGVNRWYMNYCTPDHPFERELILPKSKYADLSSRLLLAQTSKPTRKEELTKNWVRGFLNNTTRQKWYEINSVTNDFADALNHYEWSNAAKHLQRETEIRISISSDLLTKEGHSLIAVAPDFGCGALFAGDGKGGCIWAIGPKDGILELRQKWQQLFQLHGVGSLLPGIVDSKGVSVRNEKYMPKEN